MTTIRNKMVFVSIAMFVLAGGAAGAGLWGAVKLTKNVADVTQAADILRNHMQADMMHDALRADVLSSLMAQNPAAEIAVAEVKAELAEHISTFRESLSANKALATDASIRDVLGALDAPLSSYIDSASTIVEQASTDPEKAFAAFPAFKAQFSILETAMEKAGDSIQTLSDEVARGSEVLSSFVDLMLKCILGATGFFALGLLYISRRTIIKPIKALSSDMQQLAAGRTDIVLQGTKRTDEIGEMVGVVEIFRQSAITRMQLEADAISERERAEADRGRMTQEAEIAARTKLQQATSGLAAGLRRLAAGDLGFQLSEPFAPDFEALRHDLNSAVQQLEQTLTSVSHAAGSIDTGSREISTSSDDLSRRTEQQAASLEETAAALDQITVNVSNASKRADEARSIAIHANTSAAQSGAVVANAVDAMGRIEQSSNQISSIIGVIDEIAFQTNLLALNAGVEAARAGDAGRGFAVVAQEVRELAQRSAKAAKEIKDLIRNSTAEVESGVKLVRETGEALKTIEQYIVTINHHMDAIATSSREQAVGLAEVNTAVNQMDQVTQQNAAMVEETNAASATLANEASRLRELIAQFQLDSGRGAFATSSRRAA
jgi:methyl-accepting chemotaxis protein